tara:strand:+ start:242 stop:1012 length:771 start_codon:yes stop_codon:yes gene_type:complete
LLSSEVVLITGAAGRIGSNTAIEIAKKGGKLSLADISIESLTKLEKQLIKYTDKKNFTSINLDIGSTESIENAIAKTKKEFGKITAAIHSAYPRSKQWGKKYEDINLDLLTEDLRNHLGGSIIFSQKILKHFVNAGGGNLIHISSIQGIGAPKFEHYEKTSMSSPIEYSAMKAGIISITKWLAKYHKNQNIRVNCLSPGGIFDNQPVEFVKNYMKSCTNVGLLNGKDVAEAILFLLSESSNCINGQNIIIDDGWSL